MLPRRYKDTKVHKGNTGSLCEPLSLRVFVATLSVLYLKIKIFRNASAVPFELLHKSLNPFF
jgi:hypothetical protein